MSSLDRIQCKRGHFLSQAEISKGHCYRCEAIDAGTDTEQPVPPVKTRTPNGITFTNGIPDIEFAPDWKKPPKVKSGDGGGWIIFIAIILSIGFIIMMIVMNK